jgi:hypothetical protein
VTQENQAVLDDAAILARVKEIDPIVREHAAEAERERRLTTAVVDALRWSGGFRMAMPAAWGGPETDIRKHLTGGSTKAQFTGERQRTGRGLGLGVALDDLAVDDDAGDLNADRLRLEVDVGRAQPA